MKNTEDNKGDEDCRKKGWLTTPWGWGLIPWGWGIKSGDWKQQNGRMEELTFILC